MIYVKLARNAADSEVLIDDDADLTDKVVSVTVRQEAGSAPTVWLELVDDVLLEVYGRGPDVVTVIPSMYPPICARCGRVTSGIFEYCSRECRTAHRPADG